MIIGITGNIGSGKSLFARLLAHNLEASYIDTDTLVKVHVANNNNLFASIGLLHGMSVTENIFDFSKRHFFKNEEFREAIMTEILPQMHIKIGKMAASSQLFVVESAMLFEHNIDMHCVDIISINTSTKNREKRLSMRGMASESIETVLRQQHPEADYACRCNEVIVNDGSEFELTLLAKKSSDRIRKLLKI